MDKLVFLEKTVLWLFRLILAVAAIYMVIVSYQAAESKNSISVKEVIEIKNIMSQIEENTRNIEVEVIIDNK